MSANDQMGDFTKALLSLELQLKTLLDGAGGDEVAQLLDQLSNLRSSQREVVLKVFLRVTEKFIGAAFEGNLLTKQDICEQQFEETLYSEILDSLQKAALDQTRSRIQVVAKKDAIEEKESEPIDFLKALREKKARALIN